MAAAPGMSGMTAMTAMSAHVVAEAAGVTVIPNMAMSAVPVMPPVTEAAEEAAMAVMPPPIRADVEADDRKIHLVGVIDDDHAPSAIEELEVSAGDPTARAAPADIAPDIA